MGRFMLEANEAGLSRVIFPEKAVRIKETPNFSPEIQKAGIELKRYFDGESYDFKSLTYDFSELTGFQSKVLRTLLKASKGTLSYSELAEKSGNPQASRAVGTAMNKNPFPILIPCHRVIQSTGELGQYAFGVAWKKKLLNHEKIATVSTLNF